MKKTERGARGEEEQFRGKAEEKAEKETEREKISLKRMCGRLKRP